LPVQFGRRSDGASTLRGAKAKAAS